MELESIYALMERFERSSISGLELEQNGTRLKLVPSTAAIQPSSAIITYMETPILERVKASMRFAAME